MDNLLQFFTSLTIEQLVVDLVLAFVVLLFALWGAHKGLILTLCSLVSVVLGFIGGSYLARLLTPPLTEQAAPMLEGLVEKHLSALLSEAEFLPPDMIGNILLQEFAESSLASQSIPETAAAVAEAILYPILFLIGFILIVILCRFLAHALDLVARLPVLHSLNTWGGFFFGLAKGGLLVVVLTPVLLRFLAGYIPAPYLEHSFFLGYIQQLPRFF